jgi:hypothetical protein
MLTDKTEINKILHFLGIIKEMNGLINCWYNLITAESFLKVIGNCRF